MTPHARKEIQELLERLAGGDRGAIEPAFAALWPLLRVFAARALRDDGHGEDAAQQAMIKLFAQVADFDPSRDGVAWAIAIVSYEVRSLRRKGMRRREDTLDHAGDAPTTTDTPEALVVERDLARAAREVLSDMKEEDMATILAAIGERRPVDDARFRKRLQRALARLRRAWGAKHEIH
ncbi:MAG TPA: sigma-70 family RNA polymerase sigma factor [Candidatus Polarisedimenticolaceae bacterium]|nr:sigma-70 family RNA polymerase sigma factor [Candidatus Polarisedimenticolaceae bacterium]